METNQKPEGMKNAAALINGLKTQTEQNLAAALLVSLVEKKPTKPKRKRKTA